MIRKNTFHIFNNVISELYRCKTYDELGSYFLPMVNLLVPYHYASIMRRDKDSTLIRVVDPLCVPSTFIEAERAYMRFAEEDYTGWLTTCRESMVFRESDMMGDQQRLSTPLYTKCYKKFNVYDILQCGIVHNGVPLGCMSIYRTRDDGPFTNDDIYIIRALCQHLNQHLDTLLEKMFVHDGLSGADLPAFALRYGLTAREQQLVEMLTRFMDNNEIALILHVRESTLQKHFQNIFRKFGVSSRWELMRKLLESDPRN